MIGLPSMSTHDRIFGGDSCNVAHIGSWNSPPVRDRAVKACSESSAATAKENQNQRGLDTGLCSEPTVQCLDRLLGARKHRTRSPANGVPELISPEKARREPLGHVGNFSWAPPARSPRSASRPASRAHSATSRGDALMDDARISTAALEEAIGVATEQERAAGRQSPGAWAAPYVCSTKSSSGMPPPPVRLNGSPSGSRRYAASPGLPSRTDGVFLPPYCGPSSATSSLPGTPLVEPRLTRKGSDDAIVGGYRTFPNSRHYRSCSALAHNAPGVWQPDLEPSRPFVNGDGHQLASKRLYAETGQSLSEGVRSAVNPSTEACHEGSLDVAHHPALQRFAIQEGVVTAVERVVAKRHLVPPGEDFLPTQREDLFPAQRERSPVHGVEAADCEVISDAARRPTDQRRSQSPAAHHSLRPAGRASPRYQRGEGLVPRGTDEGTFRLEARQGYRRMFVDPSSSSAGSWCGEPSCQSLPSGAVSPGSQQGRLLRGPGSVAGGWGLDRGLSPEPTQFGLQAFLGGSRRRADPRFSPWASPGCSPWASPAQSPQGTPPRSPRVIGADKLVWSSVAQLPDAEDCATPSPSLQEARRLAVTQNRHGLLGGPPSRNDEQRYRKRELNAYAQREKPAHAKGRWRH